MHFFKYILFLILLLNSLFSFAGDAGQILQQERELQRLQQIPQAIPDTLQIDDDRPIVEDLGPKIWVKKVSFKGNEVFTDEELLEQVNAFINQQRLIGIERTFLDNNLDSVIHNFLFG